MSFIKTLIQMEKIALITGATAGIGRAIAVQLAQNGYNLIITGRRTERLDQLKAELQRSAECKVLTLNFDIRNREATGKAIDGLPQQWQAIDVLVNNAGLASGLSTIQEGDIDNWEVMIDTNVKGLLYISRKVMPLMVKRQRGHIVNIGSIAGREVYPNGNVYCATKHAVDALTQAMRIDMLPHGIRVTQIAPGMVETEFSLVRFKGDKEKAEKVYEGLTPLYANDIAEAVVFAVTRPAHVNISDMLIMPTAQATATINMREEKSAD